RSTSRRSLQPSMARGFSNGSCTARPMALCSRSARSFATWPRNLSHATGIPWGWFTLSITEATARSTSESRPRQPREMTLPPPPDGANQSFSWLDMDEQGQYLDDDRRPVPRQMVKGFLKRVIVLPDGITDAFVWVHGWRTDEDSAERAAQQLFQGIEE